MADRWTRNNDLLVCSVHEHESKIGKVYHLDKGNRKLKVSVEIFFSFENEENTNRKNEEKEEKKNQFFPMKDFMGSENVTDDFSPFSFFSLFPL